MHSELLLTTLVPPLPPEGGLVKICYETFSQSMLHSELTANTLFITFVLLLPPEGGLFGGISSIRTFQQNFPTLQWPVGGGNPGIRPFSRAAQ